ncbi:adenine phosphoribosyltransferase [Leishmania major strain Friedlin]|uniref:adenine phosphoribosyltransferase n=1 Tax=Leishmania major TaxID=5664 RepID=Q4Q9H8_LEIMA|nr:adenine phosphoribosyltransferase [Leishmania major strain Friedlin]CAG9576256.1 adenine_phosphoribosyltransferase [Leishmania major strain Friedlin]CAJ04500.1 adenine phosphoribosyltransferase [Leishmania major strain Friedlin]|eukprot:XP_001684020.1 adenine phosphoribosyltransferase [Leishmania major strain Friedlin]
MSFKEISPNSFLLEDSHPLSQLLKKNYCWYSPVFSPRNVPRFADVSSITESPETLKAIRDFLVQRYRTMSPAPTHILGFDARGFLFGPMIAVELGIPFVLMRKADKNAGLLIRSEPYEKEYKEAAPEVMTIRYGSISKGSRVVLIDDVLATGGTALSGLQLVEASDAMVVEMVSILCIPFLKAAEKIHSTGHSRYKDIKFISLLSEEALTEDNCGDSKNYTGPRVVSCGDVLSKHSQ